MQLMNLLVKLVEASHCAGLKVFLDDNLKQRIPAMVMLDNHVDGLNRPPSSVSTKTFGSHRSSSTHHCPECGNEIPADHPMLEPKIVCTVETEQHDPVLWRLKDLISRCRSLLNNLCSPPTQVCLSAIDMDTATITSLDVQCAMEGMRSSANELVQTLNEEACLLEYERQHLSQLIAFGLSTGSSSGVFAPVRAVAVRIARYLCAKLFSKSREQGALMAGSSCMASISEAISVWQTELLPQVERLCVTEVKVAADWPGVAIDA